MLAVARITPYMLGILLLVALVVYTWATYQTLISAKKVAAAKAEILDYLKELKNMSIQMADKHNELIEITTKIGPMQKIQVELLNNLCSIYKELIDKGMIIIPKGETECPAKIALS